jgi:hypothetical protein
MTPIEALIVFKNGWTSEDPLSKSLYEKANQVIKDEYDKIYLEAKKDQLERELNEVKEKITRTKMPF